MNTYLGRSATFIHTAVTAQQRFRPVILARQTENLDEFPVGEVHQVIPNTRAYRWFAGRYPALGRRIYDRRLVQAARENSCALLHAHFGWAASDVLNARRRLGIPLVTTFYGNDLAPMHRDRYPYERLFSEGALFFCEGPAMASTLEGFGCPPNKIQLVRIGIDLEKFPFVPRERTRPLVIIQAGRFVEKKGIDLSIRAFAAAQPRLGASELWLVGDGELRAELESLPARLGIARNVRFLGSCGYGEYQTLIGRAHICIQPSRTAADGDTEGGAPTVLIEMQASGIPVVATRHADIPAVVPHPEDLADEEDVEGLAEALVATALRPEREWRERLLEGRAFVEAHHDVRRVANEMERHYGDALTAAAK